MSESEVRAGIDDETKQAIDGELATARTAVITAAAFAGNRRKG